MDWKRVWTLSLLWGGSFPFSELALARVPPRSIVGRRVALAVALLALVVGALGQIAGESGLAGTVGAKVAGQDLGEDRGWR